MSWQVRKNLGDSVVTYSGYGTAAGSVCSFRRQERSGDRHGTDMGKILAMVSSRVTIQQLLQDWRLFTDSSINQGQR